METNFGEFSFSKIALAASPRRIAPKRESLGIGRRSTSAKATSAAISKAKVEFFNPKSSDTSKRTNKQSRRAPGDPLSPFDDSFERSSMEWRHLDSGDCIRSLIHPYHQALSFNADIRETSNMKKSCSDKRLFGFH